MEDYSTPKAMKRVGDLFERYKTRFKAPQATVEKECITVIKEVTGFEFKENQVIYTVNSRALSLRVPSIVRSELRFHEQTILQELENRLGKDGCPKIIF